jgi:HTH-type transcriptional regulator/antitoxin MqsA
MGKNPRQYPDTMPSAESGRAMTRGEKEVAFTIDGKTFTYLQSGWWCSLTNPDDMEGQLVDEDNQVAEMARRTAKALASGEQLFVPVVIRAIRQRCGLTQREAGQVFGTGEKSFEKYESGKIQPSAPTKRLLMIAMERPDLFTFRERGTTVTPSADDMALLRKTLRETHLDRIYGRLFAALSVPVPHSYDIEPLSPPCRTL